jgi:hypothetical protein
MNIMAKTVSSRLRGGVESSSTSVPSNSDGEVSEQAESEELDGTDVEEDSTPPRNLLLTVFAMMFIHPGLHPH